MGDDRRDRERERRGQKPGSDYGSIQSMPERPVRVSPPDVGNVERQKPVDAGKKGAKDVTSGPFTLKDLAAILEMLDKHDVTEFRLQRGEERLALRRGKEPRKRAPAVMPQLVTSMQPAAPQAGSAASPSNVVPFVSATDSGMRPAAKDASPSGAMSASASMMAAPSAEITPKKAFKEITSPMVGTFYRRPAVDAEPYVEVGDSVKKGDVLCIVEAMKLMNEIETDTSGKIIEVCLEDGQMVEFGEVLFRIEP